MKFHIKILTQKDSGYFISQTYSWRFDSTGILNNAALRTDFYMLLKKKMSFLFIQNGNNQRIHLCQVYNCPPTHPQHNCQALVILEE